jgi:Hsp70 protein
VFCKFGTAKAESLQMAVYLSPTSDAMLFGEEAVTLEATHPLQVVRDCKRLLGSYSDQCLRDVYKTHTLLDCDGVVGVKVRHAGVDVEFSGVELCARFMRHMADVMQSQVGETPHLLVVTHPAHFTPLQKAGLTMAVRLAGMKCLRLMPEPDAAIFAVSPDLLDLQDLHSCISDSEGDGYGDGDEDDEDVGDDDVRIVEDRPSRSVREKRVTLVFDMGGGTLDISIVHVQKSDDQWRFDTILQKGDAFCGGRDVDQAIAKLLASRMTEEMDAAKLMKAAQHLKEAGGGGVYFLGAEELQLSVEELDSCSGPTLAKVRGMLLQVKHMLAESRHQDLCLVSLVQVGGSSSLRGVDRVLEEVFPVDQVKRLTGVDRSTAVISGAVQLANALGPDRVPGCRQLQMSSVLSMDVRLQAINSSGSTVCSLIMEAQTPYGKVIKNYFHARKFEQRMHFFMGPHLEPHLNHKVFETVVCVPEHAVEALMLEHHTKEAAEEALRKNVDDSLIRVTATIEMNGEILIQANMPNLKSASTACSWNAMPIMGLSNDSFARVAASMNAWNKGIEAAKIRRLKIDGVKDDASLEELKAALCIAVQQFAKRSGGVLEDGQGPAKVVKV